MSPLVVLVDGGEDEMGRDIASAMNRLYDLWQAVDWGRPGFDWAGPEYRGYRTLIDAHDSLGRKLEIHQGSGPP